MSTKAKTFRVRRVPATATRESLAKLLRECIPDLAHEHDIHVRSLAPSPEDWATPPSQTATVDFVAPPQSLQDERETTWSFRVTDTDLTLILDTQFLGFTPLNSVEQHQHTFEYVFCTAMDFRPIDVWLIKNQAVSLSPALPVIHLAPGDSEVRLTKDTSCGFAINFPEIVPPASFQSVDDLARTFISHLKTIGRAEYSARPLVVLGHSLGGIVVKRMLLYLAGAGEVEVAMLTKIKLFIAFGVPNRGMRTDHLLTIAGSSPVKDLVETLSETSGVSSYLSILDDHFSGIARHRNIQIVSAYETEETPLAEVQANGAVLRTGASEVLVQRESAIQRGSRDPQDIFHIDKDHSNMVKFEQDDINYFTVRNFIQDILRTEGGEKTQLLAEKVDSAQPPRAGELETPKHNDYKSYRTFLESLTFEEQDYRREAIAQAYESTFGWIFEKRELGFITWVLEGTGVYWIRGKPGSGKSTMMKYLHTSEQLSEALKAREMRRPQVDLWFFFNERGTYLQKSLDGLLRSLLRELASKHPATAELLQNLYFSKPRDTCDRWRFEDLKEAFAIILSQKAYDLDITIFLDALDEYHGFPEVISQWITDLVTESRRPDNRTRVRFCFSSREWDSFVKAFENERGFTLHWYTQEDVKQYVIYRLLQLTLPNTSANEDGRTTIERFPSAGVVNLLVSRAEGVFLWVKLAMDEIASSTTITSENDLEARVSRLPGDLEEFYTRTISRIPMHSRFRAYTLLETVLRSSNLLSVDALFYAAACAPGSTFEECGKLLHDAVIRFEQRQQTQENSSRHLLNLCGGLLECINVPHKGPLSLSRKYSRERTVVQFIHRTVRDFVANPQFPEAILGEGYHLQPDNGHTFLFKYQCVCARSNNNKWNPDHELLSIAYHDECSTGRPATAFIDSLPDSFFVHTVPTIEETTLPDHYTSPFIFAVLANLQLYVTKYLDLLGDDQTNISGSYPLNKLAWKAIRVARTYFSVNDHTHGSSEMAQVLLQRGFGIDAEYFGLNPFETLFMSLLKDLEESGTSFQSEDMVNLARVLISDGGQDPNTRLRVERRDLLPKIAFYRSREMIKPWFALHVSIGEMTQMLLENGADPNIQDEKGNTALDVCIGTDFNVLQVRGLQVGHLDKIHQTAMALLSYGGRLSRRGKKHLPEFLRVMHSHGYQFPDTLAAYKTNETLASSKQTKSTRIKGKIREMISRRKEPKG